MTAGTDGSHGIDALQLPDAVLIYDADGEELARNRAADTLLGGGALADVLTESSWRKLRGSFAAPRTGIEVVTADEATWDATVARDGSRVLIVLRDVSRYTAAAARLTAITHELAARQRDLQALYDASTELGGARDLEELGSATSRLLCSYLGAAHVETRLAGRPHAWPAPPPARPPDGTTALPSSHRAEDRIAWWRAEPLDAAEQRLVDLVANRVAAGFERARLLSETDYLASHDPLTGLLNRSGGARTLETVALPAALVILDIDHFKRVNDEHGHQHGDRVLERFAEVLQRFRATDLVVRWGGEEFLLVLPAMTAEEAVTPIDRLRRRISETVHVEGTPITVSAGVADLRDPDDFERALRAADEALYRAKRTGRDRVVRADDSLAEHH